MSCFMPCHKNSQSEYRKAFVHSRVSQPTFPSCTALRVLATVLPKAWYKRVMLHFRVVHHIISHLSLVYRDNTRDSSMAYHSKALHSYNHLQSWTNTPLGQFWTLNSVKEIIHYITSASQGLLSTTVLSDTHCETNLAFSSKFGMYQKTSHTKQSTFEYHEQRR